MDNSELYEKYKDLPRDALDLKLITACYNGNMDEIRYLLTSPDLEEHADLHYANDKATMIAIAEQNTDILKYFIFELNIERSYFIEFYMNMLLVNPNVAKKVEIVKEMFEKRTLNEQLNKELDSDIISQTTKKKPKI